MTINEIVCLCLETTRIYLSFCRCNWTKIIISPQSRNYFRLL